MSRPSHLQRAAHSDVGSVSSQTKALGPLTWMPSVNAYSEAELSKDVISPLSNLQFEHATGYSRPITYSGRSRHRRASSLRSGTSLSELPLSTIEKSEDITMAPLPKVKLEVITPRSASMSSGTRTKMRPRHPKTSRGTVSLDLSKSRAENEDMGVYTSLESNDLFSPSAQAHHRVGSVASQASFTSDVGSRLGTPAMFIHPMRQTPQSFTSPLTHINNNNSYAATDDGEDEEIYVEPAQIHFRYPSFSSSPQRRPSNAMFPAASNSTSQTNLRLASQTDSPQSPEIFSPASTPPTARSSFDSMIFSKKTHCPENPDEFAAEVQRLRLEYLEKQRAKDEKIAAKETKAREKQLRKEEKRERKSMSRRGSKQVENSSSEDEKEHNCDETCDFPPFEHHEDLSAEPYYDNHRAFTETTDGCLSVSTPPQFKGPPIKRARRKASNTWGKFKFDATTFRIHVLRSIGLRTRD